VKKKYYIWLMVLLLCLLASPAIAGYDAASVPAERIPWSGYWWPTTLGQFVSGYNGHPSPLEKYDAYVSGYYPASATEYGLEHFYDPEAPPWAGHCDDWAAAAVLEPEPDQPGDLRGIPFRVGDKKCILALHYDENVIATFHGERYNDETDDFNDIYPGGTNGFHQTLVNYIAIQGLPLIMDLDPGAQIWNYPAYRYEMNWHDEGDKRYVSCKVWFADDNVGPDFAGTSTFTKTYTYFLQIDGNGQIQDEPGKWEGESFDDHPDFLWFPTFSGNDVFLKNDAVSEIVACQLTGSDDVFEENDELDQAADITWLEKDRFYCASAKDEDWYRVALQEGDDFIAFAVTLPDTLDMNIYDQEGRTIGTAFYHGASLDDVPQTGFYYIGVEASALSEPYYNIEFFCSPSVSLAHIPLFDTWQTTVTILNEDAFDANLRFNLFDDRQKRASVEEIVLPSGRLEAFSLNQMFPDSSGTEKWAKIINLGGQKQPFGFFSYEQADQVVHLPLDEKGADTLYIPHIDISGDWWTGVALLNLDRTNSAHVQMNAYTSSGQTLGVRDFVLEPGQNRSALIQEYWTDALPEDAAWFEFSSDHLMSGCVLWGNHVGCGLQGVAGIPLLSPLRTNNVLYIPHLDITDGWWTGIALFNPNDNATDLTIAGYAQNGDLAGTGSMRIPGHGNWVGLVQYLIEDWSDRIAWVKITAGRPIGGFQMFGQGLVCLASVVLPTDSEAGSELWVKHIPDRNHWWTGLALLNPFGQKVDVWAEPFDANGNNLLPGEYLWYNVPEGLGGLCNAVGLTEELFSGIPPETAYLHVYSEGPILGLGLFGDSSGEKLDTLYLNPPE
jgi:hypothetical protein